MIVMRYIRLLPMLVIVAFLSFAVRVGDFVTGLKNSGVAFAQQEVKEDEAAPMPAEQPEEAAAKKAGDIPTVTEAAEGKPVIELPKLPPVTETTETKPAEARPEGEAGSEKAATDDKDWRDAGDTEFEYSEVKEDLYKDLAARRKAVEQREKDLAVREALLEAGEKEVDQKLQELTSIRTRIEELLNLQTTEEDARIKSLVKIYEGMKAKDAANILNTLDMDVLLRIMTLMSARKSSLVMAEMDPERVRSLTILMSQQRELPSVGDDALPALPQN